MAKATDLDAWFATELAKLYATEPTNSPGILLGFPVWGEKYIERFARYCMPTLLAPANAEALRALNAKILIYTTTADFVSLWRKTWPIERAAIRLEFAYIPKELLVAPDDQNHKYLVLGSVENLLIQRAARTGMGFHMITPDTIYSDRYFERLAGLVGEQEAIAHSCLSANIDAAAGEIDGYRDGACISIPAATLGDIGWRHLHQQMTGAVLDGQSIPARSNMMIWRGKDAVHVANPHMNPTWVGPRLCRSAPVLLPTSLDAEIPGLMPGGFYLPAPDDDMVMLELSDDSKSAPVQGGIDDFVSLCWIQMNFDNRFLPVMRRRTQIPAAHHVDGMNEADIDRQHTALVDKIVADKLETMEGFMIYLSRKHRRMLRQ